MHHPQQTSLGENDSKLENEKSCDSDHVTGMKRKDTNNQMGDVFKCELCEEEEFDSEIYYRIHMKAHGSPNGAMQESAMSDDEDDGNASKNKAGLHSKMKNEKEMQPVPKSSGGSETGRYQLRTTLKPTARSSLLHHMINKSRLNRSGEDVELLPTSTKEKRKNEFDDESTQVHHSSTDTGKHTQVSNLGVSSGRRSKAKSAKLLPEKEVEESTVENPSGLTEVEESGTATIVCPICSETLNTADEESLCTHLGCHREG